MRIQFLYWSGTKHNGVHFALLAKLCQIWTIPLRVKIMEPNPQCGEKVLIPIINYPASGYALIRCIICTLFQMVNKVLFIMNAICNYDVALDIDFNPVRSCLLLIAALRLSFAFGVHVISLHPFGLILSESVRRIEHWIQSQMFS